jgi:hypothetical protein
MIVSQVSDTLSIGDFWEFFKVGGENRLALLELYKVRSDGESL